MPDEPTPTDPPQPDEHPDEHPEPEPPPEDLDGLRRALANERRAHKQTRTDLERRLRGATGSERLAAANRKLLQAEIRSVAAGKLADPSDAIRLLDLDRFAIDDDGNVDETEIAAALEALVVEKPYLAPKASPPRAPQGTRGTLGSPIDDSGSGDQWLRNLRPGR